MTPMAEMSDRTQVNFRIDTELLEAIKQTAAERGISYTQFILDACRAALGQEIDSPAPTNSDGLEALRARLAELEQRLAERLVREERLVENEKRLAERIDKVEEELGKSVA